jgi:hypothetical protein
MKPKKNHIIVKSYEEQKESHQVKCDDGSVINLYIGRKYGENSREINPVVCEVISIGDGVEDIEKGDLLIVHHNMLINEALRIERNIEEMSVTLTLHVDNMIYAKINKETGDTEPMMGSIIAERIDNPTESILWTQTNTHDTTFKVVSVPKGYEDVKPGDKIICYKLSDYEMVYNFNGSERRGIRILKEDILAVYN